MIECRLGCVVACLDVLTSAVFPGNDETNTANSRNRTTLATYR